MPDHTAVFLYRNHSLPNQNHPIMSNGSVASEISFRYNVPNQDEGPPVITVSSCGSIYAILNDNVPVQVETGPVPPESNGMLVINFHDEFYPVILYFDGIDFWIPQMSPGGELATLTPFHYDTGKIFKVYSTDPDKKPGEARISIDSPTAKSEIGIVIVGTSGLTEPEN